MKPIEWIMAEDQFSKLDLGKKYWNWPEGINLGSVEATDKFLEEQWEKFADTPVDDNENIDEDFLYFKKGENKFGIWTWFDKNHSRGLVWMMFGDSND